MGEKHLPHHHPRIGHGDCYPRTDGGAGKQGRFVCRMVEQGSEVKHDGKSRLRLPTGNRPVPARRLRHTRLRLPRPSAGRAALSAWLPRLRTEKAAHVRRHQPAHRAAHRRFKPNPAFRRPLRLLAGHSDLDLPAAPFGLRRLSRTDCGMGRGGGTVWRGTSDFYRQHRRLRAAGAGVRRRQPAR